jgi:hypothetical protein
MAHLPTVLSKAGILPNDGGQSPPSTDRSVEITSADLEKIRSGRGLLRG